MTTRSITLLGFALGTGFAIAAIAPKAHATGPAGIWSNVTQVVYEPDAQKPTRVQIHGCFLFATDKPSPCQSGQGAYNYSCTESGYMYFECPTGDEALCKLQWSEIEASIGKAGCVGWGQFDLPKGTVRPSTEKPANPDKYPLGMGVDTVGGTPCTLLDQHCKADDGGLGGAAGSAGTAGSAGSSGSGGVAGSGGSAGSGTGGSAAGAGGTGSGTGGSGGSGTGGSTAGAGAGDGSSGDDGGCTLGARGARSGGAALALLSLGALAAMFRRRRSRV